MHLALIPSHKIDKKKWDESLRTSHNGLVYASSIYLDCMADNWDAIIADDYNLIMPIPWRKKLGIKYCYTIPFVQQLGIFGKKIEPENIDCFIKLLRSNFKYGSYAFNFSNPVNAKPANNYILSLSSKYSILKHFYQTHLEKNLRKAKNFSLKYSVGEIGEAIEMFKNLYSERIKINWRNYKNFAKICSAMDKENNVIIRKVMSNNNTVSIALLLKYNERLYNIIPSTTKEGRPISAGHFLFDQIIQEFAQTGLLLDFEGSDIPGIEFFYKGFGAVKQPYYKAHFNSLPYPLRLLKR